MNYKVVRDISGIVIGYGADDGNYAPIVPIVGSMIVEIFDPRLLRKLRR